VWGFADVVESQHADIAVGERLYGYFPMGSHVVLKPTAVKPERLIDGSGHRSKLPPVYNSYSRTAGEPHFDKAMEDERSLLMPLYATSYCLYDFLLDNDWFGARQVVIISASSKTGIGLALALAADADAPPVIALTSQGNRDFVSHLQIHQTVLTYEQLTPIDASIPAVIVDMSGNGKVLSALHQHLSDNMRYCCNVGVTHYDEAGMGPGFIAERSAMFFAPGHIQKRSSEWGAGVLQEKMFGFWLKAAKQSRSFLKLEVCNGMAGMQKAYQQVLTGGVSPASGVIVSL
jgi:hypothetical protein